MEMSVNSLNCHDLEAAESFSLASEVHMKNLSFSIHTGHYCKVTLGSEVGSFCQKVECLAWSRAEL